MDRTHRRGTGRALVGLVVLAAALYGGLAAGGVLDTYASSDAAGSGSRHAAVHEHAAAIATMVAARAADRLSKPRLRETFALAVGSIALALLFASRRRLRSPPPLLLPSFVRFGAPRAPPALQIWP